MAHRYDTVGQVYARHRVPDPRITRQIERALGDAYTVVNVGGGAGAYEPIDRQVVAVEPSAVMIDQRAVDAAPVVQAVAEALPFPDQCFDAALATFTVHHWQDSATGLRELERVARRQVILTFDQGDEWLDNFWLTRDYLPYAQFRGTRHESTPLIVFKDYGVNDGGGDFFCAYWRRPHAYLDPGVRASISALALLDAAVLAPGLDRLEADLRSGAWRRRNRHLLELDALDFGYRLVVS